jgi:hypothetical protein
MRTVPRFEDSGKFANIDPFILFGAKANISQCKFEHHYLEDLESVAHSDRDREIIRWALDTNGEPQPIITTANHASFPLDRYAAPTAGYAPHSAVQSVNHAFGDATPPLQTYYPQSIDDSDIQPAATQSTGFGSVFSVFQPTLHHILGFLGFTDRFQTFVTETMFPLGVAIYELRETEGRILQHFTCDHCTHILSSINSLRAHFLSAHTRFQHIGRVHERLICPSCLWLHDRRVPQCANPQCTSQQPLKEQIFGECSPGFLSEMSRGFVGQDDPDLFRRGGDRPDTGYNGHLFMGNIGSQSMFGSQSGDRSGGTAGFFRHASTSGLKKAFRAFKTLLLLPLKLTRLFNRRRFVNTAIAFIALSTIGLLSHKHDIIIARLTRLFPSTSDADGLNWSTIGFGAIGFGSILHRLLVHVYEASCGEVRGNCHSLSSEIMLMQRRVLTWVG